VGVIDPAPMLTSGLHVRIDTRQRHSSVFLEVNNT